MTIQKKETTISLAGVVVSQALLFACFILVGRNWGAEELGNLNLNLSLGVFIGTTIAFRYELACIQDNCKESYSALVHTLLISLSTLIFLYLLTQIWSLAEATTILIFAGTFITQQSCSLYLNTLREYKNIALIKITTSFGFAISLITLTVVEHTSTTFEIYTYINLFVSFGLLVIIMKKSKKPNLKLDFFKKNVKFPKYTLPATILNATLTYSLPIIIPFLFGSVTAGFFAAAQRFGFFPVSLAAQSISGIFRRELIAAAQSNSNSGIKIYKSHAKLLALLALSYLVIGNVFFEPLIIFLLGEDWGDAATYFRILSPLYAIQIIYIPLSQVFISTNSQQKDLAIQVIIFFAAAGSLYFSFKLSLDIQTTLLIFSASSTATLILGILTTYKAIHTFSNSQVTNR